MSPPWTHSHYGWEYGPMAYVSAGVVGEAEVNGLPQQPSGLSASLQSPATWTYIWVGIAALYLILIYTGMIHITRKGN